MLRIIVLLKTVGSREHIFNKQSKPASRMVQYRMDAITPVKITI